jgi:hypothetical protein
MNRGFAELERPKQAGKKTADFVPGRHRRAPALTRRIVPGHRCSGDALTAAQCNDGCQATWSEFDLDSKTWTLPGSRRKNPKPERIMANHVMPLPPGLVALLSTIGPGEPDKLALPGARGAVIGNWLTPVGRGSIDRLAAVRR